MPKLLDYFIARNCNEKKLENLMRSKLEIKASYPGDNTNQNLIIISLILQSLNCTQVHVSSSGTAEYLAEL